MPRVPMLDLKAQYAQIEGAVGPAVARVIASQHFILGPEVESFEEKIAAYCNCAHAVGVSSGTDALLVGLMALGVGPGDEVVTSPNTFVATAACIARTGARARFVDIDPASYNMDVSRLERALSARTKAVVPVHLFGQMTDMATLQSVVQPRGIPIVEDAAQAVGAEWNGVRAGSAGTLGCLSFFPSKNLGAFGDAGAVVTNDEALARRMRLLRSQGQEPKYFSRLVGGNFRIDALQAAVLSAKLPFLDGWTDARRRNANFYRQRFLESGVDASLTRPTPTQPLTLPMALPQARHVYNQFVVRSLKRDELRRYLVECGIATEVYYPQPMHLQECFASWGGQKGDFPEAEAAAAESLALPVFPELSETQAAEVVQAVLRFHRQGR